jgi:hypothetical protein
MVWEVGIVYCRSGISFWIGGIAGITIETKNTKMETLINEQSSRLKFWDDLLLKTEAWGIEDGAVRTTHRVAIMCLQMTQRGHQEAML